MTRAYKEGHVLIVGRLSDSTVAFTGLLGIVFWGEWLAPGDWLGLALPRSPKPAVSPVVAKEPQA